MPYVARPSNNPTWPIRRFLPGLGNIAWGTKGMAGRGMGARGMGQCTDDFGDPVACSDPTATYAAPAPTTTTPLPSPTVSTGSQYLMTGPTPTAAQLNQPTYVTATTPSSSGNSLTNLLNSLVADAQAGVKIYQSTETPALIAGTNAIYNPSTGQYYNPTTGQVVSATGQSSFAGLDLGSLSGLTSFLPIILLGLAGVFILEELEHH
jgi:hypothetical protein